MSVTQANYKFFKTLLVTSCCVDLMWCLQSVSIAGT